MAGSHGDILVRIASGIGRMSASVLHIRVTLVTFEADLQISVHWEQESSDFLLILTPCNVALAVEVLTVEPGVRWQVIQLKALCWTARPHVGPAELRLSVKYSECHESSTSHNTEVLQRGPRFRREPRISIIMGMT